MSSTIKTAIPAGIDASTVIATLHNHEVMIGALCPDLISYEFVSGDKNTEATYSVTDKKPIGQTTYKLTLTNVNDGINSLVNAKPPVGTLTIAARWRVDTATQELVEDVEIEGNFVMKKMAKGNVEKTHPEQHAKLLELAKA